MIYEPAPAEGYEWVNTVSPEDYDVFWSFDGKSLTSSWAPIRVRFVSSDEYHSAMRSDFPWLGSHALVLRKRAIDVLQPILRGQAEILPLVADDTQELAILNVTRVLDALCISQSEIIRFPGTDRIMKVIRPEFREELLANVDIFRLPFRASSTYVSQRFVDAIDRAGLKGLRFRLAWKEPVR